MSLVFDALRQHGTHPTQAPTQLGSVVTPGQRRWRWGLVVGLVCVAVAGLFLWEHFYAAERIAPRNVSAALPVQPSAPTVSSAPQEVVVVDIALPTPTPTPTPTPPEAQAQAPAPSSGSRLPGDALARLAATASVIEVAAVSQPEVAAVGEIDTTVPALESEPEPRLEPKPEAELSMVVETAPPAEVNPAELFAAFNAALSAGQLPQAEEVIERARAALGESHLIVARMQGYYCMRADCPAQARQAYSTILARLPRDREAGYNLAVLDWQAGQHAEAAKRVRALLAQYPADDALRALQRQMGAH